MSHGVFDDGFGRGIQITLPDVKPLTVPAFVQGARSVASTSRPSGAADGTLDVGHGDDDGGRAAQGSVPAWLPTAPKP